MTPLEAPQLPPSYFEKKGKEIMPGKDIHSIKYSGKLKAVEIIYYNYDLLYYIISYMIPTMDLFSDW